MKYLLLGCLFLFSLNSIADNKAIKLYKTINEKISDRSISIEPSAGYDNNAIYLYSDIRLDRLQVTIKNEAGDILISEMISVFPQQTSILSMENIGNGVYILELNDGKNEYRGYFEIY